MSTQSEARFLIETPPYCPTVECYQHGNGVEHHVEGCPMYDTLASELDRFGHACRYAADQMRPVLGAFEADLRRSWRGRWQLFRSRAARRFIRG